MLGCPYNEDKEAMNMDIKRIGKNIAALRKTNGFTQEALAENLGISPQSVSNRLRYAAECL